MRLST
jgi:regulator of protease activity HflC (stomatin/prohibitin superfamily)